MKAWSVLTSDGNMKAAPNNSTTTSRAIRLRFMLIVLQWLWSDVSSALQECPSPCPSPPSNGREGIPFSDVITQGRARASLGLSCLRLAPSGRPSGMVVRATYNKRASAKTKTEHQICNGRKAHDRKAEPDCPLRCRSDFRVYQSAKEQQQVHKWETPICVDELNSGDVENEARRQACNGDVAEECHH